MISFLGFSYTCLSAEYINVWVPFWDCDTSIERLSNEHVKPVGSGTGLSSGTTDSMKVQPLLLYCSVLVPGDATLGV